VTYRGFPLFTREEGTIDLKGTMALDYVRKSSVTFAMHCHTRRDFKLQTLDFRFPLSTSLGSQV